MSNLPVKAQQMGKVLADNISQLESVLPRGMDAKRLCRIAVNALQNNASLTECTPSSFLNAVVNCAETGLEPVLGQAALVPRGGKVVFQPMYGGLLNLCYNSGHVSAINCEVVREGDFFEYEGGTAPFVKHVSHTNMGAPLTHAYAIAHMHGGGVIQVVYDRLQVLKRKNVSKTGNVWKEWEEEQWKKTALIALSKRLPKSIQMQKAVELDGAFQMGEAHPLPDEEKPKDEGEGEAVSTIDVTDTSDGGHAQEEPPADMKSASDLDLPW